MSLKQIERSGTHLAITLVVGIIIGLASASIFGILLTSLEGLLISLLFSVGLGIWAGRIRAHRVSIPTGNIIIHGIFYFGIQEIIFESLEKITIQ